MDTLPEPGLLTTTEQTLQRVIHRHPHITLAILFGSCAIGNARPDSDIDIAVTAERPLTLGERTELVTEISEATGRPVDLIDLTAAGEPLLGQILTKGRRLTEAPEPFARLLAQHWLDAADFLPIRNRILEERRKAWIGN